MKAGKVTLVGAGPHDAGLITEKGLVSLRDADCVLYDRLVNSNLLLNVNESCELISVGKASSNHTMPQAEINALLYEKAAQGKHVVRLKGGDPFVFGRGGEELEFLQQRGIETEVVPGITSAIAALTYAGIPVTHRGVATSFHVITAHRENNLPPQLDFASLGKLSNTGTLVFLMGLENARFICDGLMHHNVPDNRAAAIIENGTSTISRVFRCNISELADLVEANAILSPAIIVVGEVARLDFRTKAKPPFGKKILIACHSHSAGPLLQLLCEQGFEAAAYPCATTTPIKFIVSESFDYTWIIFTSKVGVEYFFKGLQEQNIDVRKLYKAKIAVVGEKTSEALKSYGIVADFVPQQFNAQDLAAGLSPILRNNDRILLIHPANNDATLSDNLKETGAVVETMPVYETKLLTKPPVNLADIDYVMFTSASTVEGFAANMGRDVPLFKALCIGKQTADAVLNQKLNAKVFAAKQSSFEGIVELLKETIADER